MEKEIEASIARIKKLYEERVPNIETYYHQLLISSEYENLGRLVYKKSNKK